jgi:hypothetical protein
MNPSILQILCLIPSPASIRQRSRHVTLSRWREIRERDSLSANSGMLGKAFCALRRHGREIHASIIAGITVAKSLRSSQ